MSSSQANKAKILGETAYKIKPTGNIEPDYSALAEPIEAEEGRVYCWCSGCGTRSIITDKGLSQILEAIGKTDAEVTNRTFIQSQRCIFCHDEFSDVELKTLP